MITPHGTWGDYSMMIERRAGLLWSGEDFASQWAWKPGANGESHIYWGKSLASEYHERFMLNGDWVMLDGWWDNGTYYKIDVAYEELDGVIFSTGGPQHYTKWIIPDQPYVLRAEGILTEESSGKILNWGHTQGYWPPAMHNGKLCVRQWESWWDDNNTPYERKVDRDQYLAKGVGMGWGVHQYFPYEWGVNLKWSGSY